MRNKLYLTITVLMALAILGAHALAGGGNRKGTSGADQLLIPSGARGFALNGSYLSGISGVEAIYWNPAGLAATNTSAEVMFSHANWIGDIGAEYVAIGTNFTGFGHLGLSIKSLSFGDIPLTTEKTPDGSGGVYSPTYVTLGLTYARALTDRIRAGVTFNVVSERFSRSSASGLAFDVGLQYQGLGGMKGLSMGVAIRHFGPNMKYDGSDLYRDAQELNDKRDAQLLKIETAGFQLPTTLELGMGYTANVSELHSLTLMGTFQNNNFLDDQYKIGLEYSFRNIIYLRGAYNFAAEAATEDLMAANAAAGSGFTGDVASSQTSFLYGASFGIGVKYDVGDLKLAADYGYSATKIYNGIHAFSLYVGF